MASIRPDTVYTKTAKGLLELNRKPATVPAALSAVFRAVDGKATVADLRAGSGLPFDALDRTLELLLSEGYIENAAERAQRALRAAPDPDGDSAPASATAPPFDTAERVRELTARVQAERRARERMPEIEAPTVPGDAIEDSEPARLTQAYEPPSADFRDVDVDASPTPQYVPTALERAMAKLSSQRGERPAPAQIASDPPETRRAVPTALVEPTIGPAPAAHDLPRRDLFHDPAELQRNEEAARLARERERAHRERLDADAHRRAQLDRAKRRKRFWRSLAVVLIGVPAAIVLALQFAPIGHFAPAIERTLSERLGEPVAIGSVRYVLLPAPKLVLEGISLSKRPGMRIDRLEAPMAPWSAFAGRSGIDVVDVRGLHIDASALAAIPLWSGSRAEGAIHVDRLRLHGVKLELPQAQLEPIDGDIAFAADGTVSTAVFTNANARLELASQAEGMRFVLNARDWRAPYAPPVAWSELLLTGTAEARKRAAGEFAGKVAGGAVEGTFTATWSDGVALDGKFKVLQARIEDVAAAFTSNVSIRGSARASGRFTMKAADWSALRASSRIDAIFAIARGELTNIDLLRAIQSRASGSLRGGRTPFDTLSGTVQAAQGQYTYGDLDLVSGPLTASGTLSVAPDGRLGGRLSAELTSRGGVLARSVLNLAGTVRDPLLKR